MGFLRDKSKNSSKSQQSSSSVSFNRNLGMLNEQLSPELSRVGSSNDIISNLLGLNGPANTQGFESFLDNSGYDFLFDRGTESIFNNRAMRGLRDSGGTAKSLMQFNDGLSKQFFGDYLNQIGGLRDSGLSIAQILSGAGQTSSSSSQGSSSSRGSNKGGLGGLVGSIGAAAAASDRRLKENIVKVGEFKDGLGLYNYNYLSSDELMLGVMADEVEKLRPEALGPTSKQGYKTVDYSKIKELN